jgi:hypothetical protein
MNKLKIFQPQLVTINFFPEYKSIPEDINYGQCFLWAYVAYHLFEGLELWDTGVHCPAHAFVRHRNKFYDSECLEGAEDWRDLPANWRINHCDCKYCKVGTVARSLKDFMEEWGTETPKFDTSWNKLNRKISRILSANYERNNNEMAYEQTGQTKGVGSFDRAYV